MDIINNSTNNNDIITRTRWYSPGYYSCIDTAVVLSLVPIQNKYKYRYICVHVPTAAYTAVWIYAQLYNCIYGCIFKNYTCT